MKNHPDRNPNDKEAESKFKEAAEAYSVLSDQQKKQQYDRFGHAGFNQQGSNAGFNMNVEDIFSSFGDIFGNARHSGGPQAYRGADLQYNLDISLEEAKRVTKIAKHPTLVFGRTSNVTTIR